MNNDFENTISSQHLMEELQCKENKLVLLKLMSQLEEGDRDIFVMKFIQGNSNEEIALNTGLSQSRIEYCIEHALKSFGISIMEDVNKDVT